MVVSKPEVVLTLLCSQVLKLASQTHCSPFLNLPLQLELMTVQLEQDALAGVWEGVGWTKAAITHNSYVSSHCPMCLLCDSSLNPH